MGLTVGGGGGPESIDGLANSTGEAEGAEEEGGMSTQFGKWERVRGKNAGGGGERDAKNGIWGGGEGPNGGGRGRRRNYGHREADRVPGETLESQGPRLNSKATFGNLFVAKMVARTGHKKAKDPSEWINSIKYD